MGIKLTVDESGCRIRQELTPDQLVGLAEANRIFPLFTKQDMASRWGVSVQVITNWSRRHDDFPQEMTGVFQDDKAGIFPISEVERYEQARGGRSKVSGYNAGMVGATGHKRGGAQ